MTKLISLLSLVLFSGSLWAADAHIYIDVGQAQVKKSLLALPPLHYIGTQTTNSRYIKAGQDLYRVVLNDLNVSGYFTFIQPKAYLEDPNKVGLKPAPGEPNGFHFSSWATIGTDFLVMGAYQVLDSDVTFEVYVYHVPTAKLVLGKIYHGPISAVRKVGHTFANDVVKALTGKDGMFLTKIVASKQVGQNKEIYVMDWDGSHQTRISFHHSIAISPAWSNDGKKIAYTAFAYHVKEKVRNADLFIYHLDTGKRFLVSYKKGINSGADWLQGDKDILLTLSRGGGANIYKMSADGRSMTALTHGPGHALNVEPAVSPDGKTIAFSSDRLGRPMIFSMDLNGKHVKRLTFAGEFNASPMWSPDGKMLVFAGFDKTHFDIFTMKPNGTGLTRLTSARKPDGKPANNESPSWSPDGRHILFSSDRTGHDQLYIINPDGTNERRITDDSYNWDKPKWSPFLN